MEALFRDFVETANRKNLGMYGVAVNQHGRFLGEYRFVPDEPHPLYSLSKSFASTAVGMAADEGLLKITDRVVSFFPEFLPDEVGGGLAAMTVRDLLVMASGHSAPVLMRRPPDAQTPPEEQDRDWVALFLAAKPDIMPGKRFVYDSGCTYMLSAVLQKLTGQTMRDYLMPRLFEPLGIENPVWDTCPRGRTLGGTGLHLRTTQILPFGQLYLQDGVWNGKRLLSSKWIAQATSYQIGTTCAEIYDKRMGYGYQFWMARHESYRASGAHGQGCMILPKWDAVIAYNAKTSDMQGILDNVWDNIAPKLG